MHTTVEVEKVEKSVSASPTLKPVLIFFLPDKSSDVKRIAIVGVHGWFPGKLVRAVVGKPRAFYLNSVI